MYVSNYMTILSYRDHIYTYIYMELANDKSLFLEAIHGMVNVYVRL